MAAVAAVSSTGDWTIALAVPQLVDLSKLTFRIQFRVWDGKNAIATLWSGKGITQTHSSLVITSLASQRTWYPAVATTISGDLLVLVGKNWVFVQRVELLVSVGLGNSSVTIGMSGDFTAFLNTVSTVTPTPQFDYVEFIGLAAGNTITLPYQVGSFHALTVQCSRQSRTKYTVLGSTLTLPPGLLWDGAECLFDYSTG